MFSPKYCLTVNQTVPLIAELRDENPRHKGLMGLNKFNILVKKTNDLLISWPL